MDEAESPAEDARLTYELLFAVFDLLEAHGYGRPADADPATNTDAVLALARLARAYEGHRPND